MSKKKNAERMVIHTRELVVKMAHGQVINQKASVMRDKSEYSRKQKHRKDYRHDHQSGVILFFNK